MRQTDSFALRALAVARDEMRAVEVVAKPQIEVRDFPAFILSRAKIHHPIRTRLANRKRNGLADARAPACDDRYRQTRTTRVASTRLPPIRTTARSVCSPRFAPPVRQVVP